MVKPKTNSFVFETTSNPAIFLYLDPEESQSEFENIVAHESHWRPAMPAASCSLPAMTCFTLPAVS